MNHAVWLTCKANNYLRDCYMWAEAAAAGVTQAKASVALTSQKVAAEMAEYATKYPSKQTMSILECLPSFIAAERILHKSSEAAGRGKHSCMHSYTRSICTFALAQYFALTS